MKKLLRKFYILILSLGLSSVCGADTQSVSFTTAAIKASGDLVLNLSSNKVHGPAEIRNYQAFGSGAQSTQISVGDGSNGVFNGSTYSNFSENGDISSNTIRINTDTYPELNFTSFELESGWTIEPTGSKALIIYSQSTVVINGTIQCSGRTGGAGNADELIQTAAVSGRCGGASSGAGGYDDGAGSLVDASSGLSGGTNTTGGSGADSAAATGGKGGGGGGGYSIVQAGQNPTNGVNPDGGSGGAAGTNFRNDEFSIIAGGSGGGGGAGFRTGTALQNSSGASGGSGGGAVLIRAFGDISISATGSILANGGNGGAVTGGLLAGAGGGGGGGSISIFSASNIVIDGPVQANEGAAGASTGSGNGGKGGRGRTWIADVSGTASGGVIESPDTLLPQRGTIKSAAGTFSLVTSTVDFKNSAPEITNHVFTETLAGGTSGVQYSSNENYDFTASWKNLASLAESDKQRYWKFKLELIQDGSGSFSEVELIDFSFNPNIESEFEMVGACGLVRPLAGGGSPAHGFWFLMIFPLLVALIKRLTSKIPVYL